MYLIALRLINATTMQRAKNNPVSSKSQQSDSDNQKKFRHGRLQIWNRTQDLLSDNGANLSVLSFKFVDLLSLRTTLLKETFPTSRDLNEDSNSYRWYSKAFCLVWQRFNSLL